MTHERMPIYRKYRACGLPGSWAMRLEKNRLLEKAFQDAHPAMTRPNPHHLPSLSDLARCFVALMVRG